MSGKQPSQVSALLVLTVVLSLTLIAAAQTPTCVPATNQQIIIYRAGSLSKAFKPLEAAFTCKTGVQVKDVAMGSVDAARQITAGKQACDLYAPADYSDIDLFLKPAGLANFDILFAEGKMVLAYSASGLAAKKIPAIADPSTPFNPPNSVPKAAANWYEILSSPGVLVGGGHAFLDPGAYRADMMFQLAQDYYKVPNLYNNLLGHYTVIPGSAHAGNPLGKQFDFQFSYEHNAQASVAANPDLRYVELPEEINLSNPAKNAYYREHSVVVLPGLGIPQSARAVAVPGTRVAWGITLLKNAPNRENAVKFLETLLGPTGTVALKDNGPKPISPALVAPADISKLPKSVRPLVKAM